MEITMKTKMNQNSNKTKLKETEEQCYNLFNNCIDAIFISELEGNLLNINKSFKKLVGYTKKNIVNIKLKDIFFDKKEWAGFNKGIKDKGYIKDFKFKILKKDGNIIECLIRANLNINKNNNIILCHGLIRDITDQKLAEKALKESEERYKTLLENSLEGVYLHEVKKDKFLYQNKKFCEMFGFSLEEGLKQSLFNVIAPEDRWLIKAKIKEMISGKAVPPFEFTALRKDGTTFQAEVSAKIVKFHGKVCHQGNIRNITERKKSESALRDSEELYRKLIETSPDAIILSDLKGNLLKVNRQASQFYGFNTEEEMLAKSKSAFDYIHPDDREQALKKMSETLEHGSVKNVDYKLYKKDGSYYYAELNATLIKDDDGNPKGFIAVLRDRTERKEAEKLLIESEKKYREVVDSATDAIYSTNAKENFTFINPAGEKLSGYTLKEFLKMNYLDLVPTEYRTKVKYHYMRQLIKGDKFSHIEYPFYSKNVLS